MKLRLSWSKLSSWAYYNKQDCIDAIMGYPRESNEAMENGQKAHKYIEDNKLVLLEELPRSGRWEYKDVVNLNEWLDVSFIVDYWVDDCIVDYKTGKSHNDMQLKVYAFLMALKGLDIERGCFVQVDYINGITYRAKTPTGRAKKDKWIEFSTDTHREAFAFIIDNAIEIRNHLIANNLIVD